MDCQEAVKKLYLYLDGEMLSDEERLSFEEHLKLCRQCCKRVEFEKHLWSLIRTNGQEEFLPTTLLTRVEKVITQF
ncbi:MAG: hypothetical protein PWP04_1502 [Candidatus Atribacteria bacterium]|nr:hypothetical protein [Candidatus Atribacteria bacterium]